MKGLKISVTNSDLVIKQEERIVNLFVMFKDNKYGTKYIIFTDNNKELYYGSPLVNGNKMIIMKFKDIKDAENVKQFVWNFLNGEATTGFEMVEVPVIDKLEIIDNNVLDVKEEYIEKLFDIFFKKEEPVEDGTEVVNIKQKKNNGPIIFMLIFVLACVGGFLYLKNNPELIYGKDIYVECQYKYNVNEIDVVAEEKVKLTFSNSQVLKQHKKEIVYLFGDIDIYYDFKEKNLSYKYISESGIEKYSDDELTYRLIVDYNLNKDYVLPKDYDELFDYYKNKNYSCSNVGE